MVRSTKIFYSLSLILLMVSLILHLLAMNYPHWKTYGHRTTPALLFHVGIFTRCVQRQVKMDPLPEQSHTICYPNKYHVYNSGDCTVSSIQASDENAQTVCDASQDHCSCEFLPITKGMIACTIISSIVLGFSLILILSQLFFNQYKYKIHFSISIINVVLLSIGFFSILTALILLGSTMNDDLYNYRYNLNYRIDMHSNNSTYQCQLEEDVKQIANENYYSVLDWSGGIEIVALIFSMFALLLQIFYSVSTFRNQIG